MARNGIICSILFVYFMVVMETTGQYCPKDSNPIIEDQTNCTFQINNDTTAVQHLLKMVANWGYGSIQDINIPIIISGNDTELTSHGRIRLHEWVMRNIDLDRPLYYILWRTDFEVLSFGLLNEVHSNPGFTLAIEGTVRFNMEAKVQLGKSCELYQITFENQSYSIKHMNMKISICVFYSSLSGLRTVRGTT
jgi:hypothetical protein